MRTLCFILAAAHSATYTLPPTPTPLSTRCCPLIMVMNIFLAETQYINVKYLKFHNQLISCITKRIIKHCLRSS